MTIEIPPISILIFKSDIAARNCLVKSNDEIKNNRSIIVKLGDFGLAERLYLEVNIKDKSKKPLPVRCMCTGYSSWGNKLCLNVSFVFTGMSPEALDLEFSLKSDVW